MKYGFIGCGNMGGAIAKALSRATKEIMVSDRSGRAKAFAEELGIVYSDAETVAARCDRIFIAVKPHMVQEVLSPLQKVLGKRKPLLITMAAGMEIAKLEQLAAAELPVIRIMPNTPTAIGKGVIPYCRNALVEDETLKDWREDMRFCGLLDALEERLIDAASALSGSGPAFLYMFVEALATRQHPGALKDAVCSPGGSTIVGVQTLENHGFRGAAMDCVIDTYRKNKELGK